MRRIKLLTALLLGALGAFADSIPAPRPLTSTYQVGVGRSSARCSYLTPIPHSGTTLSLNGEWSRALGCRRFPLRQTYEATFGMGFLTDAAGASAMTDLSLLLAWDLQREFRPAEGLLLGAGAGLQLDGGLLYLPRNSNNPVAARVAVALTLNLSAAYDFQLGPLPMRLIDRVSLPSLGVFFSPHYGQSYYEIYLGERAGLAHCGWWGNRFQLRNLLAAEASVCGIRLRLGYRFSILSSLASGINTRITTHECVVGISTDWVNVTRKTRLRP